MSIRGMGRRGSCRRRRNGSEGEGNRRRRFRGGRGFGGAEVKKSVGVD